MRTRKMYLTVCCLGLICLSILVGEASATLGGSVDTVEKDRLALAAHQRTVTSHAGFTVHEIQSGSVTVREYVSPSGIVFGLGWDGLIHPDLTKLLGTYAGDYENALKLKRRVHGRRRFQVRTDQVVVEKWGHMRNLQGRAYVPALFPPGVSSDDVR
ncbi:MAG: DUF2844 domain-containing protein [Nitrospiraceae bacterium]|nr:DUF2844 domain-containing protein [Nitrospiraceae bacterium]